MTLESDTFVLLSFFIVLLWMFTQHIFWFVHVISRYLLATDLISYVNVIMNRATKSMLRGWTDV